MIQPLGQRVLLKRIKADEISAGGIVLPGTAQEKPQEAIVIALGTGAKNEDGSDFVFTVKKDDKVLIAKYGGTDIKISGDEHIIMSESDVLGIIS